MQYQSECLEALKSASKISKPFEKVFMDTLKLFMAIPGKVKRGQEILGVGVIDVENHDCMTLSAVQTRDAKSLEEMDYNLIEWYCQNLIVLKEKRQKISRLIGLRPNP